MKRVSIVIPVYNSEAYLAETLESVAAQTYTDIEVILVDDGSMDKSGQICEEMAERDARFRYYRVENGGPSTARNIGISHATGEYIGFCDSDDLIDPSMYQTMVAYMERHSADIVLCDIYSERDQRQFGFPWSDGTEFCGDQVIYNLAAAMIGNPSDNDQEVPVWGSVVRSLFRRKVIQDNIIEFPQDIHFAEDLVFTLRYLSHANRAVICNTSLYRYRCNEESIMHSFYSYKTNMFDARKKLVAYICEILTELGAEKTLKSRLLTTTRCYVRECVGNACRNASGRNAAIKHKELVEILNDDLVRLSFQHFDARNTKTRIIYSMIQKRMAILLQVYYYFRFKNN